jgi:hypothetical protein
VGECRKLGTRGIGDVGAANPTPAPAGSSTAAKRPSGDGVSALRLAACWPVSFFVETVAPTRLYAQIVLTGDVQSVGGNVLIGSVDLSRGPG